MISTDDHTPLAPKASKLRSRLVTLLISTAVAMLVLLVVLSFFVPDSASEENKPQRPNIIFILADDLGWNDVGFHGSNQLSTPNIDALAYSGTILNDYYVSPLCTPSRSALMTGKHPIHTGMQHEVIYGFEPWGLGLEEKLLPEYLKELQYSTHLVGKWHLGHFKEEYTPTYRGFDSHFGFWTGHQDYYDHYAEENPGFWGFDMRRDMNVSRDTVGQYTTTVLTEEAVKLIENHDTSNPMFLMFAHAAPHAGNPSIPLQAPDDVVAMFDVENIPDARRQKYAAMVWLLDQSVGEVMRALKNRNMLENSIVIFSSDNGGAAANYNRNVASNWPLRGGKDTIWEGGVKAAAFIWSPLLNEARRVFTEICSIQDWLPTLVEAVGGPKVPGIDGKNIWPALHNSKQKTYDEILIQIDDARNISAIRYKNYKYLSGTTWGGIYDVSLGAEGRKGEYDLQAVQNSRAAKVIKETRWPLPSTSAIENLRGKATVNCEKDDDELICKPSKGEECLFDLSVDPCESINLAPSNPRIVTRLKYLLQLHNESAVEPRNAPRDPLSNPKFWDYVWTNWLDYPAPPHLDSQLVFPDTRDMDIL
ncbi:arylsulfatase B-like [Neocloeon triangulifer]|uniref:arylsulfatase B-like n=1 Tax=Neocloeon triangulifer TaxID=2078957 RepID=UPI00286F488C|nr:arylsulfatase B-like [Neocloeon triangulifer]